MGFRTHPESSRAPLVAQTGKNPPAKKETRFNLWIGKIPLEKGMATHSSLFVWEIPWTEELGGLHSVGSQSQTQLSD